MMSGKSVLQCVFISFVFVLLSASAARAQTLQAGDIIYSRLPVAPSPSGTIWAISQDGTNDRQIAAGSQPRLSPNGRYLILRRNQFPSEPYRFGQLFVRDLTTSSETLLFSYNEYVVGYFFTLDSAQIVYDDGNFSGIAKINRDGTNRTGVGGSSAFDDFPVVRTGDGLIAHHRFDSSPTAGIYTLTANGSSQQFVPNTLNGGFPSWSTDGQFIGFIGFGSSSVDNLFKIKPDGSGKVQLTNLATNNNFGAGFAWTADGSKLIVAASIGGVAGLYSVNTDGSGTTAMIPITAGANPDFVGAITPAAPTAASVSIGGRVLNARGRGVFRARVRLTDMSGETRTKMTNPFGYYRFDDVAAGETYILNASTKGYTFSPRVVSVTEDLTELNFTVEP